MSIIAEFTVPSGEFALYETLVSAPEMVVEIDRVVAHETDRIMPLFWTTGGDYGDFETAAEDNPSIEGITRLDELEDAVLYRAEWVENVETVAYAYTETGATLLEATDRTNAGNSRCGSTTKRSFRSFRRTSMRTTGTSI